MKELIHRVSYFLHITDGQGQLDLTDLSFMLVVGKVIFATGIDYQSVCALVGVILAQMHSNQLAAKASSQPGSNQ
jgi:hypothetical protein